MKKVAKKVETKALHVKVPAKIYAAIAKVAAKNKSTKSAVVSQALAKLK